MAGTSGATDIQVQRALVNTDADGNATWVFPNAYPAVPRVTFAVGPSGDVALVEARITAISATQVTVNVRRSPSVVVLGIALLSFPSNAPGVPVQFIAVPA